MRSIPSLFGRRRAQAPPRVPPGRRVYAIGDVHGRLDLLTGLIARVEADDAARAAAETQVVLLGDLIDRGPQSAELIDWLLHDRPAFAGFRFVMGNHELAMLDALAPGGDPHEGGWLHYGGVETLASYGVRGTALALPGPALGRLARARVPAAHRAFIGGFEPHIAIGDYLFVHAGIRPGVPLARQTRADLCWIREAFLEDPRPHGRMVVHGHTISPAPQFRANRIGIDTGAYRSGVLTALGLEADRQWTLATDPAGDGSRAPPVPNG